MQKKKSKLKKMKVFENIPQQDFERIEEYLLKKMPENERKEFEKEILSNAELKKEVEIQREMMLAVEAGEMKNRLNSIHQKVTERKSITRWLAVAASIVIFISVAYWLVNKPDKAERLFASNMTIDPGLPVPMSATNNYIFYDAMVDYKSGKFEEAISKWESLLVQNPENDTLNYFLAAANFNIEQYNLAIPFYEKITSQENSSFFGKSEWYLALCFLKTKDIEKLNALAKESHSEYSSKINELIQKLE
jgi:tetratricopeptide (TPR) repeat protein